MKRIQPWFVGATLRAIAMNVASTSHIFTERDITAWDKALEGKQGMVSLAMERLLTHDMVTQCEPLKNARRQLIKLDARWSLTKKGLGTCRSVAHAQPDAAPPNPNALSTKLWKLLSDRKVLTAAKAAEILIDANTRDFASAQRLINGYLRAWSRNAPEVVTVGAILKGGHQRYVMVKNGGIHPPPTKSTGIKPMPAPKSHDLIAPHPTEGA